MIFKNAKASSKGGIVPAFFVLLLLGTAALAQELPDRIRGYKVYRDKISVNARNSNSDASVQVGEPEIVDVSLTGITLELPSRI